MKREKILCIEFGKSDCHVCKQLGENVPRYFKTVGLEEKFEFIKHDMLHPSDEAIRDALWYDIPIKSAAVPSLVLDNGERVWKKTTTYFNGKADLITARCVLPVLKEMKQEYE